MFFADDKVWHRTLTEAELQTRIVTVAGGAADRVVALYRRLMPDTTPRIGWRSPHDRFEFPHPSLLMAERRGSARRRGVDVFVLPGRRRCSTGDWAPHAIDVPFTFDTLEFTNAGSQVPGHMRWRRRCRARGRRSRAPACGTCVAAGVAGLGRRSVRRWCWTWIATWRTDPGAEETGVVGGDCELRVIALGLHFGQYVSLTYWHAQEADHHRRRCKSEGLHTIIGHRHISRFLNDLAQPHVAPDLTAGYAAMANDQAREQEARPGTGR